MENFSHKEITSYRAGAAEHHYTVKSGVAFSNTCGLYIANVIEKDSHAENVDLISGATIGINDLTLAVIDALKK